MAAALGRGADPNVTRPISPVSPLHMAAMQNRADIVVQLIQAGACLETRSASNGNTPLLSAASYGASMAAIQLVRQGADVRVRDRLGYSALDHAGECTRLQSRVFYSMDFT